MNLHRRYTGARGFSLLEVLVALILLGIITAIYMRTSHYSQKNTGRSVDWQAESAVIEKTIERLRTGHTLAQVQNFDTSFIDSSNRINIHVVAEGRFPPASACVGFDSSKLAKVSVQAWRETNKDSISITTYLWFN